MEIERYTLSYEKNKNNGFTRLLGEEFVKNNKNKGRIIYKNKIYPLQGVFLLKNFMGDILKIHMLLSKNTYNKSFMFKDCSSLISIKLNNEYNISFDDKSILYDHPQKNN